MWGRLLTLPVSLPLGVMSKRQVVQPCFQIRAPRAQYVALLRQVRLKSTTPSPLFKGFHSHSFLLLEKSHDLPKIPWLT